MGPNCGCVLKDDMDEKEIAFMLEMQHRRTQMNQRRTRMIPLKSRGARSKSGSPKRIPRAQSTFGMTKELSAKLLEIQLQR